MSDSETVELFARYRFGDQTAAASLHQRYRGRIHALVARYLTPQLRRRVCVEDLGQSIFRTFFRRSDEGRFTIEKSGDLWKLLAQIAVRKARKKVRYHTNRRRDVAAEEMSSVEDFAELLTYPATAEQQAALRDECDALLADLAPAEALAFRMRLQGESLEAIADALETSARTVARVLERVGRRMWRQLLGEI